MVVNTISCVRKRDILYTHTFSLFLSTMYFFRSIGTAIAYRIHTYTHTSLSARRLERVQTISVATIVFFLLFFFSFCSVCFSPSFRSIRSQLQLCAVRRQCTNYEFSIGSLVIAYTNHIQYSRYELCSIFFSPENYCRSNSFDISHFTVIIPSQTAELVSTIQRKKIVSLLLFDLALFCLFFASFYKWFAHTDNTNNGYEMKNQSPNCFFLF